MPATYTSRLEGLTTSVAVKPPCRVATTTEISLFGLQAVDGVTVAAGDRVLVRAQSLTSQNGIWVAAAAEWTRALDFDGSLDAVGGTQVSVLEGVAYGATYWRTEGDGPLRIGSDSITFTRALVNSSATVSFQQNGVGAIARDIQDRLRETISIKDFGAAFDVSEVADIGDATDDTDAWKAALAYLRSMGGGTLMLPPGVSKVTAMIDIPIDVPIRIKGAGCQKVYPGNFAAGTKQPSTVIPYHSGRAAFRFKATANGQGGFVGDSFNLNTIVTGVMPEAAFMWELEGFFPYGFTFRGMGIHNFRNASGGSAFDVYRSSGSENSVGAVLIDDCVINHNNWIARTLGNTQFNGFRFTNNKAGQNGYLPGAGGIAISGHDVAIKDNILEGQRDAVKVTGAYKDVIVEGNYFEANVGIACIQLSSVISFRVGPNQYGAQDPDELDHKVYLSFCGPGICTDAYWPIGVNKMMLATIGNESETTLNNDVDGYGFQRLDRFDGMNYSRRPIALAQTVSRVSDVARDYSPQTGLPIPVQAYTTTGTGIVSLTQTISGSSGQWAVVCIPFKQVADGSGVTEPYLTLNVNNTAAAGTRDFAASNFARYWREDEWCLMTAAIKLGAAMTSLGVYFYPFGLNPTAGRIARFLRPFTYVVDDANKIVPYMDNYIAESVSATPTTGTWATGDTLLNSAGGLFVCTAGGSPGTWGSVVPA